MLKTKLKPDFIYRGKRAVAVILKIKEYEDLLEAAQDSEDIEFVKSLKEHPIETVDFDAYLAERGLCV